MEGVWRECGGSVEAVCRECGGSVEGVWRQCGESVSRGFNEKISSAE